MRQWGHHKSSGKSQQSMGRFEGQVRWIWCGDGAPEAVLSLLRLATLQQKVGAHLQGLPVVGQRSSQARIDCTFQRARTDIRPAIQRLFSATRPGCESARQLRSSWQACDPWSSSLVSVSQWRSVQPRSRDWNIADVGCNVVAVELELLPVMERMMMRITMISHWRLNPGKKWRETRKGSKVSFLLHCFLCF